MPAALLMARLSSEVRLLLQSETDPAVVVGRLNKNLCDGGTAQKFVTFLLLLLDGERHELTVVNAGHMGPMVRRACGRVEVIGEDQAGPLLGVVDAPRYGAVTTPLGPGEVVVLYTDGVSESMDPEGGQFGLERLKRALAEAPQGTGPTGEAIRHAIRLHAAGSEQSDDITLLCLGRP